jgi:hypothetical protein
VTDVQDLAAYLSSKGIKAHRANGSEVTAHCFYCADGDPKGKGKLYLNVESWLYDCKRCGANGNRKTLLEFFGDEDELQHVAGEDPMLRRRILTEAAALAHEMLLANEPMLEYLLARGLSAETIVRKQYGFVPQNVGISRMLPCRDSIKAIDLIKAGLLTVGGQEFFNRSIVIPYWSHGTVVQLREKKVDGKYRTAGGDSARLYNADSLRGADDVVVCEGEFDTDMLEQTLKESGIPALERTAVVGLPGAGAWPEGFIEGLGHCRRVFAGFDPDETGNKFAAKLKDELGSKVRKLELPDALPKCDWNDYLKPHDPASNPHGGHDWRDVQRMLIEADLEGKRMFTVADAAAKWTKQRNEAPGIKLGWTSLDAILRPGLKPGQLLIPLAKTGTGKTVWLSNVAHNIRARRVLIISLEMTAAEVFEHFRRIHHFHFPTATPAERDRDYANIRIVDQNRLGKGDLRDLIREYAEDVGAKPEVVTVDYLQYFARGFPGGGQYEKTSDAVMELKAVAKEESLAIICPSQVSRSGEDGKPLSLDDARDSGVVEETGDFVLALFRPDQIVNKQDPTGAMPVQTGAFNAQLLKSRHGGKGRQFTFRMSLMSLAICDSIDRKNIQRIEQENSLVRGGTHYDDFRHDANARHAQTAIDDKQAALL